MSERGLVITAANERPVYFESPRGELSGVLTVPERTTDAVALLAWGGGAYPSSGRNRIRTRLARAFAEQGFAAFRFDYSGVGESGGPMGSTSFDEPYADQIVAAVEFLRQEGFSRCHVVAHCFGAWSVLNAVPQLEGIASLLAMGAPLGGGTHTEAVARHAGVSWWVQRAKRFRPGKLLDAERRRQYRRLVGARLSTLGPGGPPPAPITPFLRQLADRGVPMLLIYGLSDFRADLEDHRDEIDAVVRSAPPPSALLTPDVRIDARQTVATQQFVIDKAIEFASSVEGTHRQ